MNAEHVTGRQYWRSLEELAEGPEALRALEAEFPGYDPGALRAMSRRRFMKLMGASMALAGLTLTGCRRWPKEKLAPYTAASKDRIPGVPEFYATGYEVGGISEGLLAKSFDGRPIKIEGNPEHPYARTSNPRVGAASGYAQASVLEMYDPERSRTVIDRRQGGEGRVSTWAEFDAWLAGRVQTLGAGGAGLAILSEAMAGPSVEALRERMGRALGQAKWYEHEPIATAGPGGIRALYALDKARTVVSLDADLLGCHPARLRHAADWAATRKSADDADDRRMSRWYVVESTLTSTGAVADVRLPVRPVRVAAVAVALAAKLGVTGAGDAGTLSDDEQKFVDAAAADLKQGGGLVAAGEHLPADVQDLARAINGAIRAVGSTVRYVTPALPKSGTLVELASAIRAGQVKLLVILGGNPAYDAPADLDFAGLLKSVPDRVHLSLYDNETSLACTWHVPRAHYLEAWGDGRAYDGTVTMRQPLIEPLYGGRSAIELLAGLLGEEVRDGERIVRRTFAAASGVAEGPELDKAFRKAIHDGFIPDSGWKAAEGTGGSGGASAAQAVKVAPIQGDFDVRFVADSKVYDGRFANNGWLQETPDPLTKLTWDNAALISVADCRKHQIALGDVIRVTVAGRSLEVPAYPMPGQPTGVITVALGYGRTRAGHVGTGVGSNAYVLRTSDAMGWVSGAGVSQAGRKHELALTQDHHLIDEAGMEARAKRAGEEPRKSGKIIREATLAEYKANPDFVNKGSHAAAHRLQLFDPPHATPAKHADGPVAFNDPHAWGMAIDMAACVGCTACMVACQAENNVPVVGKPNVLNSREMHWIRLDRYFKGDPENPRDVEVTFQPMLCAHCENAPCEQVCPVAATVHDTEGLNTMVYNRCIGTRYCSNNCPYKVRRFNYFDWHSRDVRGGYFQAPWLGMPDQEQAEKIDPVKRMVFNPDVTVRMRGVMEKCTYCVQRIQAAKLEAKRRGEERVKDGEVIPACQQTCPTQAIVFGDLNDPNSAVSRLHRSKRTYAVLDEDLDTRPRTKYLAKLSNPA